MPDKGFPDPREEDIIYADRRISRPDASLPDWEVPDAAYRPVPIVWFTGAMFMQMILQIAVLVIGQRLLALPLLLVFGCALLASGLVWHHTIGRGMAGASLVWRFATLIGLLAWLGLSTLALFG